MPFRFLSFAVLLLAGTLPLAAQTPAQVLVVVNKQSLASREIGEYYLRKRGIPVANLCTIDTAPEESISYQVYEEEIQGGVAHCLRRGSMREDILYIVLTKGVPLKMGGETETSSTMQSDGASVDSELTLLYQRSKGVKIPLSGPVPNPFFRQRDTPFRHPLFPMYLVTRLDAYTMADMKAMVDRSLLARNTGKFVIDLKAGDDSGGNEWLRTAALLLPKDRVILDEGATVLANIKDVIAYASWGSNDPARKHRLVNMQWLPGAIATEYVSTNARTFKQPPATWDIGPWSDRSRWFEGGPQTLAADYIHEGASGASGQALEPFLAFCPRPEFVLPAYYSGRNLAESFYMGITGLSWMNVVIGDPLMNLVR